MENIITNPGLQHLAEKILWNLDVRHLKLCGLINQSCQQILDNPIFWLKKFRGLSEEKEKDWIKVLKSVKNSEKKKAIISYLQWILEKEPMDLPCYTSPAVHNNFRKKILESCMKEEESSDEDIEIVKILAPLTDNPNALHNDGETPFFSAAMNGHTEIVKILVPLIDNPNASDRNGETPIHWAASEGHTEIVKILAHLTDNPNAPDKNGFTPIHEAAVGGYAEILKILVPLAENSNALNNDGETPFSIAKNAEIREIFNSLNIFRKHQDIPLEKSSKKQRKKF